MSFAVPIAMLVIGLLAGALAVWLLMRGMIETASVRSAATAESMKAVLEERVENLNGALADCTSRLEACQSDLSGCQGEVTQLKQRETYLTTLIQQERKDTAEKLALLNKAKTELTDAFRSLAAEALQSNNQSFLALAKENLERHQEAAKGDLEKRQQRIDALVQPIKESLDKVDGKLQALETSRAEAYSALRQQIVELNESNRVLQGETANLVSALKKPAVGGRWGEIQLKRVVELAGMVAHCDFYEQHTLAGEDGQGRPDMLVRLPAKKSLLVDSKAPLSAFLEALEAQDDVTRQARLADFGRNLRAHITSLGKKGYYEKSDHTPEFVVLFLPGEVFFSAALAQDPSLIEFGVEKNVIIATPTTLIALLKAVAYGWRHEVLAESAKQISDLGQELYKRICKLSEHLQALGNSLDNATHAYNSAIGCLESRVLVQARRFQQLGAAPPGLEIEELSQLTQTARLLQATELRGSDDGVDGFPAEHGERRLF